MKELSLNILDIAKNSVTAGASLVTITVTETAAELRLVITDNGCGMTPEFLRTVTDPFTTTRTTRRVGMGIPLLQLAAQQSGGGLSMESTVGVGTTTTAWFDPGSIDMPPLGDLPASLVTLVQGNPETDFVFTHTAGTGTYTLDTRELRMVMGDISLAEPEVLTWITDYLTEQESTLEGKRFRYEIVRRAQSDPRNHAKQTEPPEGGQ